MDLELVAHGKPLSPILTPSRPGSKMRAPETGNGMEL